MYLICHKGPTLYVCFPRLPGRWKSANRSRNEIPGEMARWWEIRDPTKRVLIYGGTWQRWWLMSVFSRIICAWDFSKSHAKHEAVGCGPLHGVPAASSTIKTLSCVMSYFYSKSWDRRFSVRSCPSTCMAQEGGRYIWCLGDRSHGENGGRFGGGCIIPLAVSSFSRVYKCWLFVARESESMGFDSLWYGTVPSAPNSIITKSFCYDCGGNGNSVSPTNHFHL